MKFRKRIISVFTSSVLITSFIYLLGIYDFLFAKDFDYFEYPLNVDLKPLVNQFMCGKEPSIKFINEYPFKFINMGIVCNRSEKIDLVIVVKSAMNHFGHRDAIRQTWGQSKAVAGKLTKLIFILGIADKDENLQRDIDKEAALHNDIVQADFIDNYYNNTLKTMMGFRWVYNYCPTVDYYLFSDDDMYISTRNLFEYLKNPYQYETEGKKYETEDKNKELKEDGHMFAGYIFDSTPQRHRGNRWRVSLEEYPWNRWPKYVTAGAYVLSNKSMKTIYAGSLFVKHFKFDDIYLAIVAKKVGITSTKCSGFHYYKKKYTKEGYRKVIAMHGYGDHEELKRVWNEQNSYID